ncbi:MAG: ATPase domain-containing protein, partial [Candidatus Bathyarchaeia archaeon]
MSGRFISTGVEGLDAVLGGGFPRDSLIILAGNPGTGKTVFSAQFLYRGAVDYNEKGLYVSFAESRETFFENMRGFGFDFEKLERDGKFRFLDLLTVKEQAVPSILSIILDEAGRAEAKRLVLDSFSAMAQTFKEPIDIRIVVHAILSKI